MGKVVSLVLIGTLCAGCKSKDPNPPKMQEQRHEMDQAPGHHHGGSHHHHQHQPGNGEKVHHKSFADAEKWAKIFDNPARDAWQKPAHVVSLMDIAPGMTVADIGAGTGYFVPHLARAVGDSGRVLAVDVAQTLIDHMNKRFADAGIANAKAMLTSVDDPGLHMGSTDRIVIVNTWHHIGGRVAYGKKLAEALAPGGKLYIVDFTVDSPMGPPIRIAPAEVIAELASAGLTGKQMATQLPRQYVVVAHKR